MPQHVVRKNVLRLDAIFFPEAENITTVPLTLVLTFSKCSESICVKPSSESFVFEKDAFLIVNAHQFLTEAIVHNAVTKNCGSV